MDSVDSILRFRDEGIEVYINLDPRGYVLKIDEGYMQENKLDLYRDMGGYGIIAPDLR